MQTFSQPPSERAWRELYIAALLETDAAKLPDRIAEAQKALLSRARELFQNNGGNIEEEHAMDDAMYALRMLRNACQPANPADKPNPEAA